MSPQQENEKHPSPQASRASIVGQIGDFHVHRIHVNKETAELTRNKRGAFLGMRIDEKEWPGKSLQKAFKKGSERHVKVVGVTNGGLAANAGVLVGDIICLPSGTEPIVFHELFTASDDTSELSSTWKLLDRSQLLDKLEFWKEIKGEFSIHVLRTRTTTSGAKALSRGSSLDEGVAVSSMIVDKMQSFPSLSKKKKTKLLKEAKQDTKRHFESNRDAILESLPDCQTNGFFQVGYAKWGRRTYIPALVVSPFTVPPGRARSLWLKKYNMRRENNTLDRMNHLVLWYGESESSDGRFALVPQRDFKPYSAENAIKFGKLPLTIERKLLNGEKLTESQQIRVRARSEIKAALEILPKERMSKLGTFEECHESLTENDFMEAARINASSNESCDDEQSRKRELDGDDEDLPSAKRKQPSDQATTATVAMVSPARDEPGISDSEVTTSPSAPDEESVGKPADESSLATAPTDAPSEQTNDDSDADADDDARFAHMIDHIKTLKILNKSFRSEHGRLESNMRRLHVRRDELMAVVSSIRNLNHDRTTDDLPTGSNHVNPPVLSRRLSIPAVTSKGYVDGMDAYLKDLSQNNSDLKVDNTRLQVEITVLEQKNNLLASYMEKICSEVMKLF